MSLVEESFDIEKAKAEIKILVEKYEREKSNGRLESYSEEQTKNDFILRLFKALGWDVYNDHSNTLTAEEKASRGRVDYGFRINDIPKFFLEAKSFRAGVDKDEYAFQSINYAWLKGCTWAVLTNFEKMIIFNAEWKEKLAINCLFISLNYSDFLTNFDQLYLLSREAFTKSLLDKEAEKWHKKIKKTPIDQQLLQDLMKFRESLTQSIIRRNSSVSLTDEELDESVQKILDRVIFIRTVEDRQIEPPHLRPLIREDHKGNLWKKLAELYRYFDDAYDSNLFSPHECEKLIIGDEELETIIRGLHETGDGSVQYDFGAINVDVLGNVYEQYLGHILKKTKKSATIQDGSSKRKEQGIYYTPTYIVDYIVKNTVGNKISEMGRDWKKMRILDPACGSGSFLIKAFDYLTSLDKDLEKKEEVKKELYGNHIATERFVYLKNNIFGVDLDTKAVEIAQLNLMIRATEKKERLPSLQQNIKNGDSLVDDKNIAGHHAFKWEIEFQDILKTGSGFDVVIGNPPYGAEITETYKNFIKNAFKSATGRYDSYYYFIERGIFLLKQGGFLGFIVPDTWLTNVQTEKLREVVLNNCSIQQVIGLPQDVFPDANVDTCIIILKKEQDETKRSNNVINVHILDKDADLKKLTERNFTTNTTVVQKQWAADNRKLFNIRTDDKKIVTIEKIRKNTIKLDEISEMTRGINPYAKSELIEKYGEVKGTEIVENRIWHSATNKGSEYKKELVGGDIGRYSLDWQSGQWVKYGEWLSRPRNPKFFTLPHLVVQRIRNPKLKRRIISTFIDPKYEYYNNSGLTNIIIINENYSIKYVLAILNSNLMNWYYKQFFIDVNIKPEDLRELPIKKLAEIQQDTFIKLVDKILSLNEHLSEMGDKITNERARIEEEINKIDTEINELIYKIYGLDEAEQKIVEDSM